MQNHLSLSLDVRTTDGMSKCNVLLARNGILVGFVTMKLRITLYHGERHATCCVCFAILLNKLDKFVACVVNRQHTIIAPFASCGITIQTRVSIIVTIAVSVDLVPDWAKTFSIARPALLVCRLMQNRLIAALRRAQSVIVPSVGNTCSLHRNQWHSCAVVTAYTMVVSESGATQAISVRSAPRA